MIMFKSDVVNPNIEGLKPMMQFSDQLSIFIEKGQGFDVLTIKIV